MRYLVKALLKYSASDLHLKIGRPPLYRINGRLIPAKMPQLDKPSIESVLFSVLNEKQRAELFEKRSVDCSFGFSEIGRFRCNVFFQRGSVSAVIRLIPLNVPSIDELGLPPVLKDLCYKPRGLVLVTGATGSGKSTTLAAMVQHMNENRYVHVLTLEDPIEFIYRDQKASITQRELGSDIRDFSEALYSGLRQDPDVIVIGEMREQSVVQTALTAAETGHLVIATLHTNDAISSLERILDIFPGEMQNQVRVQLASCLVGIVSQRLLVKTDGTGRVPATEVMIKSPAIENYIRRNEVPHIYEAMANSNAYYKMQTFNQDLERLTAQSTVSVDEALKASNQPDELRMRLAGVRREEGYGNDPSKT